MIKYNGAHIPYHGTDFTMVCQIKGKWQSTMELTKDVKNNKRL